MTADRNLTFVIADDYSAFCERVKLALETKGFRVLGQASDGEDAVRLCKELKPDIAVLDISMPKLNGIDAARQIMMSHPYTKVIILTVHSGGPYLLESLVVGASGYITKSKATATLFDAVEAVTNGEIYVRAAARFCP